MKTVLILGHLGKLGNAIKRTFWFSDYNIEVIEDRFTENNYKTLIENVRCDIIVNCLSNNCRYGSLGAELVNVTIPLYLNDYCNRTDKKLVQFSSDYVFKDDYDDTSVYTRQKKEMDSKFDSTNALLIRTSNLISFEDNDNFIYRFRFAPEVNINDIPLMPTDVDCLAEFVFENIDKVGPMSVYGFTLEKKHLCLDLNIPYTCNDENYFDHTVVFKEQPSVYRVTETVHTYNKMVKRLRKAD